MGTTTFVWDPVSDCVLMELDETDNVKAVYTNEARQYGGVLCQRRGNTSHYHHHDALGSTRFLTDSSGNVTDTYLNDAWGNSVASTGTTVNPFKWVGRYGYYTDNSTGQVYVRARMYQPIVARWCSARYVPAEESLIEMLTPYVRRAVTADSSSQQADEPQRSEISVERIAANGLGDSECPTESGIYWSFRPSTNAGWPCDGLLVQIVNVSCQSEKCAKWSKKEESSYVETWSITKGKMNVDKRILEQESGKLNTDRAFFTPEEKSWGYYLQVTQIAVLCDRVNRGRVSNKDVNNNPYITLSEKRFLTHDGGVQVKNGNCTTKSGILQGRVIESPEERLQFEKIWEKRHGRLTADRTFHVDWDCCCKPSKQLGEGRP
ncbi:MAG: hypothetical protein U0996_08900 [Planctomycetaceae bacterium]